MKTKLMTALCLSLVLVLASTASAQIQAGSEEDKAFQKITAEKNPDAQALLLVNFEKQFPQSKILPDVYQMLVNIYTAKNDTAKIADFGEKAIKADPQNVSALLSVSRVYAMQGRNLDVAVTYAQKAVDNVEKMKTQAVPSNYTDAEWRDLIKANEEAAKSQLSYAKAVRK